MLWDFGEPIVPSTGVFGYEKLIFSNAKGNLASRRVKEKTGAILIGEKDSEFVDPEFTVSELWELSKEAWESRRPK